MSQPSSDILAFTKTYHKAIYPAIDPSQPSLSAAGKTILITAGHAGIGYSIATNFAIAGASHIVLLARRAAVLSAAAKTLSAAHPNTQFHTFAASITDAASVKAIFTKIRTTTADPTILITSAAFFPPLVPALSLPPTDFRTTFETNGEKVILDISTSASHVNMPMIAAYSASKAAFTKLLAVVADENRGKGVRVHSFHPGAVYTEGVASVGFPKEALDWDDVGLVGGFAVWLASEEGRFLEGRFMWANWDVEELKARRGEFEADPELLRLGLVGKPVEVEVTMRQN